MRDAAGEQAERLEAVGLDALVGRERHLVGIAKHDRGAQRAAGVIVRGPGCPHDGHGGVARFRGRECMLVDQRRRSIRHERAGEGVARLAARAPEDETENVADESSLDGGGIKAEQARGVGVGEDNFSGRVGDEHAFTDRGERLVRKRGGQRALLPRAGRQGACKAHHAHQLALAVERAVRAEDHRDRAAALGAQPHGLDEGVFAGGRSAQPSGQIGRLGHDGQRRGQGLGVGGQLAFGMAEEFFPCAGEPRGVVGEIDLECGQRAAAGEILQPRVVGRERVFQLASVRDVEMHADEALQRPRLRDRKHAGAMHPDPMAALMAHAKLAAKRPRPCAGPPRCSRRGGGRIIGMHERRPARHRGRHLVADVAEDFFPRRREPGLLR